MLIDQVSCIQKQDFYLKILNCLRNLRLILKISTYFGRRIEQRRLCRIFKKKNKKLQVTAIESKKTFLIINLIKI